MTTRGRERDFHEGQRVLYIVYIDRLIPAVVTHVGRNLYTIVPESEDGRPMRSRNVAWYSIVPAPGDINAQP